MKNEAQSEESCTTEWYCGVEEPIGKSWSDLTFRFVRNYGISLPLSDKIKTMNKKIKKCQLNASTNGVDTEMTSCMSFRIMILPKIMNLFGFVLDEVYAMRIFSGIT